MIRKHIVIKIILLSIVLPLVFANTVFAREYTKANLVDFVDKKVGVIDGSVQEKWAEKDFAKSEIVHFTNLPDGVLAVENGMIDAMFFSDLSLRYAVGEKKDLEVLLVGTKEVELAPIFAKNKEGDKLKEQFNEYLEQIKNNGTLDRIVKKWTDGPEELRVFDNPLDPQDINGKIDIITQSGAAPYDYLKDGSMVGLEIELVREFCRECGYKPIFHDANFSVAIMGVNTGKYDMGAAALMITDERAKLVNFANSFCTCQGALLIKKETIAPTKESSMRNNLPMGDITEFYGRRIGVQSGSTEESVAGELFKNPELSYYTSFTDAVVALQTDKIDALYADDVVIRYVTGNIEDLVVLDIGGEKIDSAPIFQKTERGDFLRSQYNAFLKEFKDSGKLEEITKKWIDGPEEKRVMDTSELPNINGIVTIGTEIGYAPHEYIKDGELVGLETELLREFCKTYGYYPEFCNAAFDALVMGVHSGKFDIGASALTVTEERSKSVNFGEPFLICYPSLLVKKNGGWTGTNTNKAKQESSNVSEFIAGFNRTFIEEDRWKMFINGIEITFLITSLSVLFGTVIGFGIYLLCRNGNKVTNMFVNIVNWFITGMPLVVFLMILFYVVFAKSDISGTTVAIIGFSIVFALTMFHLLKLGEGAVNQGQKEAAYALGYSDIDTFFRIILPQAAKHFLPSYKAEVVSLIKATAVVGYITVMDITKIGDVIRGRTYDAVFPLFAVVVAYFLLCAIFKVAINYLIKKVDTKKRPHSEIMKGIKIS